MPVKVSKELIEELKAIIHMNGIKFRFNPRTRMSYADCDGEHIEIGTKDLNIRQISSSVFHEMAHIILYRERKFYIYHSSLPVTKRIALIKIRTGLKAERATDRLAERLMKLYFPKMKYMSGYSDKKVVRWFQRIYLKDLKKIVRD